MADSVEEDETEPKIPATGEAQPSTEAPQPPQEAKLPEGAWPPGPTEPDPNAAELVDQTGRPLGARAQQTRQRILEATVAELESKSMRDLRVIDIARRVGSSPATFYQYFKDIEDVVLQLTEKATGRTPIAVESIGGDWSGPGGLERAKFLVGRAIQHWQDYGPVLRARNNASDEGDERFRDVRTRAIMPMINAFAAQIRASQAGGQQADDSETATTGTSGGQGFVHPVAGAMIAFSALDRMAMNHDSMVEEGISHEEIVDTGATILQTILTTTR